MKSKIIEIDNIDDRINEKKWDINIDKEVEDEIYQIRLKNKFYEKDNIIKNGDIIKIKLESENKKYNRIINLNVGTNLFSKELESQLPGKVINNEYEMLIDGSIVHYKILEINRLVVKELDDSMAQCEGIDNVKTKEELVNYIIMKHTLKTINSESYEFIDNFTSKCKFEISEDDLSDFSQQELERCRKISRSLNKVFDEMSEEELLGAVGVPTINDFLIMIKEFFIKRIKSGLVACRILGIKEEVTYTNYGELFGKLQEYIAKKIIK